MHIMMPDFYHIGSIISVFLGLVILFRKNKTLPNYILAIWLIVLGINIFIFHRLTDHKEAPGLLSYANQLIFIFQLPAALLFADSLYFDKKRLLKRAIYLSIPFIIFILFPLFTNIGFSVFYHPGGFWSKSTFVNISEIFIIFACPLYLILSLLSIKKLKQISLEQISEISNSDFVVFRRFIIGLLAAFILFLALLVLSRLTDFVNIQTAFSSASVIISLSLLYAGLFGLQKTDLFTVHNYESPKPVNQNLSESEKSELENIMQNLEDVMKTKKPYLRPRLSLYELSEISGIQEIKISASINSLKKENFYDYINSFRVKEFIEKCRNNAQHDLTLTAIAYECGFNSKSAFFDIFKKQTGQTPSQFIKYLIISQL